MPRRGLMARIVVMLLVVWPLLLPPGVCVCDWLTNCEACAAQPVDELTFLKSVADEEAKPAPPSRRVSNPSMAAPQGSRAVEAPAAPPAGKAAPGVAKTLKCGECGTLNRPTEWYCERCGAELAGI